MNRSAAIGPSPAQAVAERHRGLTIEGLWSFVAALLPGITSLGVGMSTIDLAYHLRAGAITLGEGAPLARDLFTFTAAGAAWLNQQWGAQVVLALASRAWGWAGLALLRAALVAGTYAFLVAACRRRLGARTAALVCSGGFLLAAPYLGTRPQLFGVLLFATFLWALEARRGRPWVLWLLPPLSAAWANLHGSFPLGVALLGLAALEDLGARRHLRRTATAGALVALATLANPFGPRVWAYAVGLTTNPIIARAITEWAPPDARTLPGALFFLSVFAVAGWMILSPSRPPWTTVLKAGVLAALGLLAVRGVVWWAVALPVMVAEAHARAAAAPGPREAPVGRRSVNAAIAALLLLLGLAFLSRWPRAMDEELVRAAPEAVTRRLAATLEPGDRIFNAQIWGSWFELALPHNPVFVDSRIELFPPAIWRQYYAVSNGREGWQAILDRWGVRAVAADREQQAGLIPRIRRDPGWRLVYEGEEGLLFLRA
jgi:hypothetical protein